MPKQKLKIAKNTGLTLVEILIAVSILSLLTVTASTFQKDIFSLSSTLQSSLNAQLDGRHLIKVMVSELRRVAQSNTGSYPIEVAATTTITFYSDINNNGLKEKIRYFQSGTTIKKGVIIPTGSPLVYNAGSETVTTLISNVVSSSTQPIFQYYPATYTGTTTPLAFPVDIASVRLIKITIMIDNNPARSPAPITVTSQVSLRNLKDNL